MCQISPQSLPCRTKNAPKVYPVAKKFAKSTYYPLFQENSEKMSFRAFHIIPCRVIFSSVERVARVERVERVARVEIEGSDGGEGHIDIVLHLSV